MEIVGHTAALANVVAETMKEYNPNSSWQEAEDQQEEFAGTQKNND